MIDIEKAYKQARKFKSCELFTGKEDYANITDLLYSPQGIEFCTKFNVPSLEIFAEHKSITSELEKKGLYINAGEVEIKNSQYVWLVGKTTAKIIVDNPLVRHQVVLMHGAKADIIASNFAVVFIHGNGKINKTIKTGALIL